MNATLSLYLQGPGADDALDDLLSDDAIRSRSLPPLETQSKDQDWLSLAANLLEIAFATGWAVQKLSAWWARQKEASPRLSCVIEGPDGTRLDLNSATPEQIAAVLTLICRQQQP